MSAKNIELSDEQEFLIDAARGTLARVKTLEVARDALEDPAARRDLWPLACEAGWPGLLVSEDQGGAGLGVAEALLVLTEVGRVLAGVPLLGHLPATLLLERAGCVTPELADGTQRAAFVAARPPGDVVGGWTVDARAGATRVAAPVLDAAGTLSGEVAWVLDAPGADVLVVAATREDGTPVGVVVDAADATVEPVESYDATRLLAHVGFAAAPAAVLESVDADALAEAWYLTHALIAAESLGAVEAALALSIAYANERFTFGRPIGSYQAIKHALVEVLRVRENTYSLLVHVGWTHRSAPAEFALAASAARSAAGHALDTTARTTIAVHGGIGATWEHDAPLFFRRAQITRRLHGGTAEATDRVAGEVLALADAAG